MKEDMYIESVEENITTSIPYTVIKSIVDFIGALIGCLFLLPIVIFVKLSYVFTGDFTTIFFTQTRIGKNGKPFKLYKFRSMIKNADKVLDQLMNDDPDIYWEYKRYKKLKNDPRITKVGRFIRNTSIDEFPQFINVLKGEMSLVGPRPYLPKEKPDMGDYYSTIIKSKPGITGYWQVNGRSGTDFIKRLILDEYYSNNKDTVLDMKILIKTIMQVFFKEGV